MKYWFMKAKMVFCTFHGPEKGSKWHLETVQTTLVEISKNQSSVECPAHICSLSLNNFTGACMHPVMSLTISINSYSLPRGSILKALVGWIVGVSMRKPVFLSFMQLSFIFIVDFLINNAHYIYSLHSLTFPKFDKFLP
jgi:hypothetical protein